MASFETLNQKLSDLHAELLKYISPPEFEPIWEFMDPEIQQVHWNAMRANFKISKYCKTIWTRVLGDIQQLNTQQTTYGLAEYQIQKVVARRINKFG